MNYDQIDGSYCKKNLYTFLHTYIYIRYTRLHQNVFQNVSSNLVNIICSILKPRIIWINRCVSIQFSPTYLSWQSSLKSFRVTIVYVSRKETKFEKQPITQSEKLLVSFSDRSLLPLSLHFCLINTSFFTLRFRGIESSALLLFIIR